MSSLINEVLCFMKNKMNILPFDILSKLCCDFYSEAEIVKAKELLYATAFLHIDECDRPRMIGRRGASKATSDVEDMLKELLALSPANIPVYVAADLSKIPPVGPNNFNFSSIMNDVQTLKEQMCLLKKAVDVNLAAHSALCSNSDATSNNNPVEEESPPPSTSQEPLVQSSPTRVKEVASMVNDVDSSDERTTSDEEEEALEALVQNTKQRRKQRNISNHSQPHRAGNNRDSRPSALRSAHSTDVQKQPGKLITGSGRGFALKATAHRTEQNNGNPTVRTTTGIFVTRLAQATRPRDVAKHVRQETGQNCRCEPLTTRHDSYRSFCIRCPARMRQTLLNPNVWPRGVLVREYKE